MKKFVYFAFAILIVWVGAIYAEIVEDPDGGPFYNDTLGDYGSCMKEDGTAYSTETDGETCVSQAGPCYAGPGGGALGVCEYCQPGEWSDPQPIIGDFDVGSGMLESITAYGYCGTGAESDKCIDCPIFFCAKILMWDHGANCPTAEEACDGDGSQGAGTVFVIGINACDP